MLVGSQSIVNNFFEKNINRDILINHIYPFARNSPPPSLLRDIRSFSQDIAVLDTMYTTHYNQFILHTDLVFYLTNKPSPTLGNSSYTNNKMHPMFFYVYRRLHEHAFASTNELFDLHNSLGDNGGSEKRVTYLNRRIWGLLTPEERTDFINRYILAEEDEIEDEMEDALL